MLGKVRISNLTLASITFCAILWVYVYLSVSGVLLGGGDSGQWAMLARFYRGAPVPSYRDATIYPPVYPVLLALAITLVGSVPLAINLLGATIFAFSSISFFVIGKELWSERAGVIAIVLGSLGQYFLLYLVSFGGYPQLLSLGWINLVISQFAIIYRSESVPLRQWIRLSLLLSLSFFTYLPATTILLVILGVPMVYSLLSKMRAHSIKDRVWVLSVFLVPLVAYGANITFHLPTLLGYASNEAALHYRGISAAWFSLFRQNESTGLLVMSIVATVLGLVWASKRNERQEAFGFYFVSLWVFSILTFMSVLHFFRVGTDYARFSFFIVQPLILNLAGALSTFIEESKIDITLDIKGSRQMTMNIKKWGLLIVLLVLLLSFFPASHRLYRDALDFYSIKGPEDFQDAIEWVDKNTLYTEAVLTQSREGKWLEGLTGRPALFFLPERAAYRPWEHERSIIADSLLTSSTTIENGYVLVKFQEARGSIPIQPSVSVHVDGEYVEALWLRNSLTQIKLITPWGEVQSLSLSDFPRFSHETFQEPRMNRIISKFERDIEQTMLCLNRTITVTRDSPIVSVHYNMQTAEGFYVKDFSLGILDPWGRERKDTQLDEELRIIYTTATKREIVVRVAYDEPDAIISEEPLSDKDRRIATWLTFSANPTSTASLQIQIITAPTGRLVEGLHLYRASELLEEYNVKAALLPKDHRMWYRKINLKYLGFVEVFENDSYVVLARL